MLKLHPTICSPTVVIKINDNNNIKKKKIKTELIGRNGKEKLESEG